MENEHACNACGDPVEDGQKGCMLVLYEGEIISITCDACLRAAKKMSVTVVREGNAVKHYQTFAVEV